MQLHGCHYRCYRFRINWKCEKVLQIVCVVTFLRKVVAKCKKLYNTKGTYCVIIQMMKYVKPPGINAQAVFCCANLRKGVLQDGENDSEATEIL